MKFLLSIPCQLIVVIFIALTVSSIVAKPLQPLTAALSIGGGANSAPINAKDDSSVPLNLNDLRPLFIALAAALTTFVIWHAYRCYRSESAIAQTKKIGARISTPNGYSGVMRYLFSDVKINLADKHVSARTMASLQQIHNLTSLNVANCGLNQKTLFQFEYCRFLQEIDVSGNSLSRDTLLKFRRKIAATMHHSSIG